MLSIPHIHGDRCGSDSYFGKAIHTDTQENLATVLFY